MDVALLCFGRWAFGDVDNEDNWILLGSKDIHNQDNRGSYKFLAVQYARFH